MSEWNAMTYEGKDTILRVVDEQAEQMFELVSQPHLWELQTPCDRWATRDVVGHIVDTTEGYFRAFDAARGNGTVPDPFGLLVMSEKADAGAAAFRSVPQAEMVDRLRSDYHKMREILEPIGPEDWSGFIVTHPYMGPVPAFMYAAGQLMDYGVHGWDVMQATGRSHALDGEVADLLVPFMFEIWRGTVAEGYAGDPYTVGIRVSGHNAGDYRVTMSDAGMSYEQGEIDSLPSIIEFDAGSMVLTAFGRTNTGTVRGDTELADRFLNSFFRI